MSNLGHRLRRASAGTAYTTLIEALSGLGLATNLKLCLDAGDAGSYTSGQSWLDRSGNGYDFYRGTTSGSESSDPTFTGSAGDRSAYWSFDGGDSFRYDSSNEPWMNNLHKDNAAFWFIAWVYFGSVGTDMTLFGTNGIGNNNPGGRFSVGSSTFGSHWNYQCWRTALSGFAFNFDGNTPPATTWVMLSCSLDESVGTNGAFLGINDTYVTGTSTYSSPSSSDAVHTAEIGARGNGAARLVSGSRMACLAMGEGGALSQANVSAIYEATRDWFGV